MLGNVFYGVVASSFTPPQSGGGGSEISLPSAISFVDQDVMFGGGLQTLDIDLNFDTVGTYIVAAFGRAGDKGSDNVLALDYIGTFSDNFQLEEVYSFTNEEFETVRFVKVEITSAGVHSVRVSNTHSFGIYRAGAACWKLEGRLVTGNFVGYRIDGSGSVNADVFADGALIAVVLGRDRTPGDLTDNSFTGVANTDQPLTLMASGQEFYYGLFSEDEYENDGSVIITHSPSGELERAEAGILSIDPGAVVGTVVRMDETRVPSGYEISNNDLTVVNTSGGSDYRRWVPAEKVLPADLIGKIYWEVKIQATQSGSLNGYCGVFPVGEIDGPNGYDSGENLIVSSGGIGYRGNGSIWADGNFQTSGLESYGDGDVLMFTFEPSSGSLWVGKNGVWDRDPATEGASHATPTIDSTGWYPIIQGRDQGDGGTLRSIPAQFDYPVPVGALSYGEELTNETSELSAYSLSIWSELGGMGALTSSQVENWLELGGGVSLSAAKLEIWIEEDLT